LEAALQEYRGRPGPMRVEIRVIWPGNDVHWIVFLGQVLADAAERPSSMRGVTIDGTRRRRREEAVRDLAERVRLAMIAGKLAAWEADLGKRTLRWSPEAAAMHGISPDQVEIGLEEWDGLIHPEDAARCTRRFTAAMEQPSDYSV